MCSVALIATVVQKCHGNFNFTHGPHGNFNFTTANSIQHSKSNLEENQTDFYVLNDQGEHRAIYRGIELKHRSFDFETICSVTNKS